ncbi:MAG: diaminopimelate epimerase [Oscillospiraceae bacterium]|nr:diaminopimelate epimerase [Oscillospiraceae bacterium]
MYFTKMHGLGNDYIYLDCMAGPMPDHLPELSQKLSHRHFGIGADGIICILPSTCAAARMRIFNADGSEGEMCGNGIRCVGKLLFDQGYVRENAFAIETRAGVKYLTLQRRGGNVEQVTVDMGRPLLSPPLTLDIARETYTVTPVSMGNPHAVVFLPEIATLPLADLGPLFEHHSIFPNRINTEFVAVRDRTLLEMRVWERGSGETMACGTGACAALAAAVTGGYTDRRALVRLAGGDLAIEWNEQTGRIYMTGPAVTVYKGEWNDGQY